MEERVLFVDDDSNVLEAYQRKLQHVLRVRTAEGAHAGLREIQEKGPFAVVVADMHMPLMNGIEFLKKVREIAPDTVRIMLTGNADIKTAMEAVNEGCVFRFLTKPCPAALMGESLIAAIKQYRLVTAEREVLEGTLQGTAELLIEVLSWANPEIFGRAVHLRNMARAISAKMGAGNAWEIDLAAMLGQIGMLAIPPEILAKISGVESLDEEERRSIESVPAIGAELLERIPRLENVARIVMYQNKNFDGTGFPHDNVAGKEIPLGSRVLKVAADYLQRRAEGLSRTDSVKALAAQAEKYDPAVLAVFFKMPAVVAPPETDKGKVISIAFKDLGPGTTLAAPILTTQGRTLVARGTTVTSAYLVRLRKYAAVKGIREPIEVIVHPESD